MLTQTYLAPSEIKKQIPQNNDITETELEHIKKNIKQTNKNANVNEVLEMLSEKKNFQTKLQVQQVDQFIKENILHDMQKKTSPKKNKMQDTIENLSEIVINDESDNLDDKL